MQTFEERMWSAREEIEAQHYFQPIFDRLRLHPEDTLLSDLVNSEIPDGAARSPTPSCTRR